MRSRKPVDSLPSPLNKHMPLSFLSVFRIVDMINYHNRCCLAALLKHSFWLVGSILVANQKLCQKTLISHSLWHVMHKASNAELGRVVCSWLDCARANIMFNISRYEEIWRLIANIIFKRTKLNAFYQKIHVCECILSDPTCKIFTDLTHWGWVTHICVDNLTIIGSDNGLSPGRRQAIL